jgi:O-antigen ligase
MLPQPVVTSAPFAWRGIMTNRNSLGAAAALAASFFLVLATRRQIHPVWGVTLCGLSLLALAEARTRTPFVGLTVSLLVWIAVAIAALSGRSVRRLVRTVSIMLVVAVAVVPFLTIGLAVPPGTPDTLNGRPYIWKGASTIVRLRPLTGYGYAVVWGRQSDTFLPEIDATTHPWAVNAHNSIVNIATEMGIPAALIACVYVIGALYDAGRLCERVPSAFSLAALLLLIGMTVMGFAEAQLLHIHSVFWMLMVAVTVAVRRQLQCDAPSGCAGPWQ